MSAPIVNLLLNALQLLQGQRTQGDLERLAPGVIDAIQTCPTTGADLSMGERGMLAFELELERLEREADDEALDFDAEECPRKRPRAKHLHVDVIGLDDDD